MTVNVNKLKSVIFINISTRIYFNLYKIRENKTINLINRQSPYNKIVMTLNIKVTNWIRNYYTCVVKQDNINMLIMITIFNDFI